MTPFTSITSRAYLLFRGMLAPPDALTVDGYDMTFGTSVLGQFVYVVAAGAS